MGEIGSIQIAVDQLRKREIEAEEGRFLGHDVLPELQGTHDFYGLYMFTLLLANDLNEAKYLWKRAPQEVKSPSGGISQLSSAWEVGKALWHHNTKQALHVISTTQWHNSLRDSVDRLHQELVTKECLLLHSTFKSTLTTTMIESRLGISAADAYKALQAAGWKVSAEGLTPPPAATSMGQSNIASFSEDILELQRLVQIAAFNEQRPHKVDNKAADAK